MHYRDDQTGLEARRDDLRQKLDELRTKTRELDEQLRSREAVERELSSIEARLAHAARRLPLLDRVTVASPCHASWEAMTGDERARFCKSCEKTVYNLSAMTAKDAEALLAEHGEKACVRFYRREDGTVMTTDCPVGARKKRVKRAIYAAAGAGAMAATAALGLRRGPEPTAVAMGATSAPVVETAAPAPPPVPEVSGQPIHVAGVPSFRPPMGKPAYKPVAPRPITPKPGRQPAP